MSIVNDNMSETPETDDQPIINAINDNGYQVPCVDIKYARKLERERDEALESLKHIGEYGTEEINAAVELRQKLASALVERDEVQKAVNGLCKHLGVSPANTTLLAVEVLRIQREREEAITRRMETIMQCELYEQERDEAREQVKELIYISERAIALAEIDFENDKFGVVSELRDGLEKIKEETK